MNTMELSEDTAMVLALKRQLEEFVDHVTAYVEERYAGAEAINDSLLKSLSVVNETLDNALLLSINEEFAGSGFKRI